jgi:hypothetical protein
MDSEANERKVDSQTTENHDRREAVRKLGRLAAYAAPFTVLALFRIFSSWPGRTFPASTYLVPRPA